MASESGSKNSNQQLFKLREQLTFLFNKKRELEEQKLIFESYLTNKCQSHEILSNIDNKISQKTIHLQQLVKIVSERNQLLKRINKKLQDSGNTTAENLNKIKDNKKKIEGLMHRDYQKISAIKDYIKKLEDEKIVRQKPEESPPEKINQIKKKMGELCDKIVWVNQKIKEIENRVGDSKQSMLELSALETKTDCKNDEFQLEQENLNKKNLKNKDQCHKKNSDREKIKHVTIESEHQGNIEKDLKKQRFEDNEFDEFMNVLDERKRRKDHPPMPNVKKVQKPSATHMDSNVSSKTEGNKTSSVLSDKQQFKDKSFQKSSAIHNNKVDEGVHNPQIKKSLKEKTNDKGYNKKSKNEDAMLIQDNQKITNKTDKLAHVKQAISQMQEDLKHDFNNDKTPHLNKDTAPKHVDKQPTSEELNFISDSREIVLSDNKNWGFVLMYAIAFFMIIALIWASVTVLDEITTAQGKVIPSSQVQVIQNLEGGILSKLYVREGDTVQKGQILLRIDDTRFSSSFNEGEQKYITLLAAIARLRAEASGADQIIFPQLVVSKGQEAIKNEQHLFDKQKSQLASSIATLQKSYDLAVEELEITKPLVDEGLMSQLELLRLKRQINELKGDITTVKDEFRSTQQKDLNEKEAELLALKENLKAAQDRLTRTTIRSPVTGTVNVVHISTVGAVIQPGIDILEIVPTEDNLLIEAKIKPQDIAFIRPKQNAVVKVTAYDYTIYGGLEGKVEHISADTITEEERGKEESYYKILVRTQKNYLGSEDKPLYIIPGMTVTVDVMTGKKSVLDYLLKPFLKARQSALRER